jgi:single-strand DNA-binding protein
MSINQTVHSGRMTKDIEVRQGNDGKVWGTFSLAVYMGKDKNGEQRTMFLDCTASSDGITRALQQYGGKGRFVEVAGQLDENTWTDKQTGQVRKKFFIRVVRANVTPGQGGDGSTVPQGNPTPTGDQWTTGVAPNNQYTNPVNAVPDPAGMPF